MTKRSGGAVVFTTIAIFALFPALALAQKSNAKSSADAALENVLKRFPRSEPGCAIGIEHGPRQLILRAAGSANLEQNVPIGVDTVFEAGSASKQFTAAAVLLLANDRKLSLDDDVRKYVPELQLYHHPPTSSQSHQRITGLGKPSRNRRLAARRDSVRHG